MNGYISSVLAAMVAWAISAPACSQADIQISAKKERDDPLFRFQWHLSNTGQRVFGDLRPIAGTDLNIADLHAIGMRGKGVTVGVVDDGLEIRHQDLSANIVSGASHNFVDGSTDPTPINADDAHGTGVAGLIAAVGWNGLGGRGVAPEARLKGFNFLSQDIEGVPDQDEAIRYSWGGGVDAADVQVFNNSWGSDPSFYPAFSRAEHRSWARLVNATRGGRGGIYVKSAGNSFKSSRFGCPVSQAAMYSVSCIHSHVDPLNNLENVITVAAIRPDGTRSSYSSAGSSLWVSGFGGEYGYEIGTAGGGRVPEAYVPALLTTDLEGCSRGYNVSVSARNRFDGGSRWDESCSYQSSFNGTSAAAPTVSGVAALMLGVNPSLSARDVKYILAVTARPIDLGQQRSIYRNITIDPGWVTNAAGHRFSNWYGFGLVNAAAAVDKAKNFPSLPKQLDSGWVSSEDEPSLIAGIGPNPAKMGVSVSVDAKIETVQIAFSTTHNKPSNLRGVLTSPSGTRSYVFTPFSFVNATGGFEAKLIASNSFLDENARGDWTLELIDVEDNTSSAELKSFELRVLGYKRYAQ